MIAQAALLAVLQSSASVVWVDDEPRAVISILRAGRPDEGGWERLFATKGYKRLKEREEGMGRGFTDESFREFVLSPEMTGKAEAFEATLKAWSSSDFAAMGAQAMSFLPKEAKIKATVFPLIKPRTNSFVWDVQKDPAIMLYLDPKKSASEFQKTVVHELHHIGYASCCPSSAFKAWTAGLSEERQNAWGWLGAFGEGYAVLAAAGSRQTDPMLHFSAEVKAAWKHAMEHLAEDMKLIESFVLDTVSGKIKGDDVTQRAMEFYGTQGPWYSVGYMMAAAIEEAFGRAVLLKCYLDPRLLMPTYNRAVARLVKSLPMWSGEVLESLGISE